MLYPTLMAERIAQRTHAPASQIFCQGFPVSGSGIPYNGAMQLRSERNPSAMIREAMAKSHGSVANAARLLGMRRTTLVEKMRKREGVG